MNQESWPMELGVLLDRYVDPFVGKGERLFHVMSIPGMREGVISDVDPEQLNIYRQLQNHVDDLAEELWTLEKHFTERNFWEKDAFRKSIQNRCLELPKIRSEESRIQRAAAKIFLDRSRHSLPAACGETGIMAVKAESLLPPSVDANVRIFDERELRLKSRLLTHVKILHGDFIDCLEYADYRTLLYLDPPPVGTPMGNTAFFTEKDALAVQSIARIAETWGAEVILNHENADNQ